MFINVLESTCEIESTRGLLDNSENLVAKLKRENRRLEITLTDYAVLQLITDEKNYVYYILLSDNGTIYKTTSKAFWRDFKSLPNHVGVPIRIFVRENKKNPNYPFLACEQLSIHVEPGYDESLPFR